MPVHNALPHLDHAIRSIVEQSYADFEFVILDDGSTDGSADLLHSWAEKDSRIRLFHSERNLGPAGSSNRVVAHARGSIIARMDADDISHPSRLERQLHVLDEDPAAGLVATLCDIIGPDGTKLRDPEYWKLQRHSWFVPFPHGSIMYRRELFERIGGYRPECEFWEDQDLVLRMAAEADILVLPYSLYKHRQSCSSTRVSSDQDRVEQALDLMYDCMACLRSGSDYEERLRRGIDSGARVNPRVFISLGSLLLWSGGKPRLFRRLLKRGRLGLDVGTPSAVAWTLWASASPASLRAFLALLVRARSAPPLAGTSALVKWRPPRLPTRASQKEAIADG